MLATHRETATRYELYRREAREYALEALPPRIKNWVRFTAIDTLALAAFRTWELMSERKVTWDWSFVKEYTFRHPKAFDLAVWSNKTLCSLTLGRPSYRGTFMRMDFMERLPRQCPLAGELFDISALVYETYARLIGASQLRLINPMNKKLIEYYMSRPGFSYHKGKRGNPHYLVKDL